MPKNFKRLALVAILFLMSAPFTNCGQYASTNAAGSASSASCTTSNCVTPSTANMSLIPNMISTGNQSLLIYQSGAVYSISGDCNEGGYVANSIVWELHNSSGIIRRSTDANAADPSVVTASTQCVNGRFLVSINSAIANAGSELNLVPVSRTDYYVKIILTPIASITNGSIGISATVPVTFAY